jgi:hypothetical protein
LEASELAPAIGKVIPIAKALGVGFEEVGANIAVFTRLGVSASEAVTALRSTLAAILKPTSEAKEELALYGLTFDELRNKLKSDGLMSVLSQLNTITNGNVESLGRMIPSVEALADVLGTAGAQGDSYAQVLANINNATGMVDKGFQTASQGSAFDYQQTMNSLKNAAITLGEALIPVFQKIAAAVRELANRFRAMDADQRQTVIQFTALTAASPILISALSGIMSAMGSLASMVSTTLLPALAKMAAAVAAGNPIAIGLLVIGAAIAATVVYWEEFKTAVANVSAGFADWFNKSQWVRDSLLQITYSFQALNRFAVTMIKDIIQQLQFLGVALELASKGMGGAAGTVLGVIPENSNRLWKQMIDDMKTDWDNFSNYWNTVQITPITEDDIQGVVDGIKRPFIELQNMFTNLFAGGSVIGQIEAETQSLSTSMQQLSIDTAQFGVISDAALKGMRTNMQAIDSSMSEMRDRWTEIWAEMGATTEFALTNMLGDLVSGFTSAMTGLTSMEDVFRNIGNQLANLLEMLGKTAIYKGLIEGTLATLFAGNPAATIGIGLGALAMAGAMRGMSNRGTQTGIPAFANGALVTGPMLAMVGDNKNASRDPEAILPVSKLQGYISQAMGGVGGGELYGRLSGNDLLITNDRNAYRIKRITGRG